MKKILREKIEIEIEQRTDTWHALRAGRLTASQAATAARLGRGSIKKLWREKVGTEPPFEGNEYTRWGSHYEKHAEVAFEDVTGLLIERSGFAICGRHQWRGASPDFYVGKKTYGEIKCPFYGREKFPESPEDFNKSFQDHLAQVQFGMDVTERHGGCHFVYYQPESKEREMEESIDIWFIPYSQKYADVLLREHRKFWVSVVTQREVAGISKENPRPEVPFIPVKLVYSGEVTDAFQDIVREELAELASGVASGDAVGGGAVGTGEHGDGEAVGVGGGEVGGVA